MKLTSQELSKKCYDTWIRVKTDKVFGWCTSLEEGGWEEEYHLLRLNYEPDDWDLQTDRENHPDLPCASLDEWLDWFDEKLRGNDLGSVYVTDSGSSVYFGKGSESPDYAHIDFENRANACAEMALWLVEQGIIKLEKLR